MCKVWSEGFITQCWNIMICYYQKQNFSDLNKLQTICVCNFIQICNICLHQNVGLVQSYLDYSIMLDCCIWKSQLIFDNYMFLYLMHCLPVNLVSLSLCRSFTLSLFLYLHWVSVSSRVGRVRILMFTSLCQFGFGVSVAFSGNYYFFLVLRFLLAMVSSVCVCTVFLVVYPCVSVFLHAMVGAIWRNDKSISVEWYKSIPKEGEQLWYEFPVHFQRPQT